MISGVFLSLCLLMQIALIISVVKKRLKHRVSLGDGGHDDLLTAIRQHGNFMETIPMGLLVLLMLELSHFAPWVIVALGSLLLLGRVCHIYGVHNYKPKIAGLNFRVWGMLMTFAVYGIGAVLCVVGFVTGDMMVL